MIQKSPYLTLVLAVAFIAQSTSLIAGESATNDQSEEVQVASDPTVPPKRANCHVQVRVRGVVNGTSYSCEGITSIAGITGSRFYTFVSGANAVAAREYAYDLAVEDALSKQPNCTDFELVSCDVVPQQYCDWCDNAFARVRCPAPACRYKVTYTVKCCNGLCYSHESIDTDRKRAFDRAKSAACFWAGLYCEGQIRCGCWKTTIVRN